jgi:hypothetical protein
LPVEIDLGGLFIMSEKATLLTSIPPVAKSAPTKKSTLSSVEKTMVKKTSQLLETKSASPAPVAKTEMVAAREGLAAGEGATITAFQGAIYSSFVLTFCLAGFAAVMLFRKASKVAEARFVVSTKTLAIASIIVALHGFFTTYLFANYLNGEGTTAPLVITMALWVLVGPAIGVILNHLLTPGQTPEKGAVLFDACAYVGIFGCATISLVPGIKENAALGFSLLAGFLFIVPVARSFTAFGMAKARHPELRERSDQVLIYTLLILPALLPILAFAHACRMGDELTLFLFNFITCGFVLVAGLAMIASADEMQSDSLEAEVAVASSAEPVEAKEVPVVEVPVPEAPAPAPAVVEFAAPSQPKSKKLLPRKPVKPGADVSIPPAPRRPGANPEAPEPSVASNAPSRVKAPAKPKKRF